VSLSFDYPNPEREAIIIAHESGVDAATAESLAVIGEKVRNLKEHGFEEGVSTRLLIYTGALIGQDISPRRAADIAIVNAVSDDPTVQAAIGDIVDAVLP
jgi:nitric oxide reductase NorQ protein